MATQAELDGLLAYQTSLLNELAAAPLGPNYSVDGQSEQLADYVKMLRSELREVDADIRRVSNELGLVPPDSANWQPKWRRDKQRSPYLDPYDPDV